jgi:large subunit ribosomal protein L25
MATVELKGEIRTAVGKAEAKRLRRMLRIPSIVYGGPGGPVPVTVNPTELLAAVSAGENVLINLSLAGGDSPRRSLVILKELQVDPVKGRPLHADFLEVSMERKIRVEVPLILAGEPVGVKDKGGILEHALRQLFVECLPLDIPEKLLVDVSGLDVGDAVHVRDLRTGEGVRVLEDEDAPAAVEEAPTEPEVVGRKEKAEAEGEPEAKPKAEPKAEAKPK